MTLSPIVKRILIGSVFVIAVLALAYLLYIVFFRTTPTPPAPVNVNNGNIALPNINETLQNINRENTNVDTTIPSVDTFEDQTKKTAQVLTPSINAQDPAPANDGSLRYYAPVDGKFYKVNSNGSITSLSDSTFQDIEKVTWSDNSNEAILEFPDGSNIYYNIDTNRQVTLPKEYEEFDFSPTSSKIVFKYMHIDQERRVLAVSNPDGTGARTLESLGENADHVMVEWSPTGKVAASYAEFIDLNRQELGFVGLKGENFKGTIVEGRGLQSSYSPSGKELLYSVYSSGTEYKPSLWIVDADGEDIGKNRKELKINTFANKCSFNSAGTTVYCGIPQEQKYGYGLEPGLLDGIGDDIYRIDIATGSKTKVATPLNGFGQATFSVDDDSMVITEDSGQLFFRDKLTGQLIKIDL